MKKTNSFVHIKPYRGKMHEPIMVSDDSDYPAPQRWIVGVFVAVCVFGAAFALGVMAGSMTNTDAGISTAMDGAVMLP